MKKLRLKWIVQPTAVGLAVLGLAFVLLAACGWSAPPTYDSSESLPTGQQTATTAVSGSSGTPTRMQSALVPTWTPKPEPTSRPGDFVESGEALALESDEPLGGEGNTLISPLHQGEITGSSAGSGGIGLPLDRHLLGYSTLGWPLEYHRFGSGRFRIVCVGGIHGGYEWNTVLLAYRAIDYFSENPDEVPESITLYIVPVANPDGLAAVVGHAGRFAPDEVDSDTYAGRFNGNGVDLNRNWGCDWSATAYWREQEISGGSRPFSEVEVRLLRDFIGVVSADAVIFWHSAMPGVYPGGCSEPIPLSVELASAYAEAAGYPTSQTFDDYPITGDATNWLALDDVPAITAELSTHDDIEWARNLAGLQAVLRMYGTPLEP